MKIGALLWAQQTERPAPRSAAIAADRAGFDSLAIRPSPLPGWPLAQPNLRSLDDHCRLGSLTERATIGTPVGAITFCNPGLVAKLATTVDRITGGRAVLGLGRAWHEHERRMFGINFGAGAGERLDRLH